ncbi:hypothetical protein KM295_10950 [Natronomonas sp. F2-12]|jgi:hypothetical protein|uniref:Uncharacterized protein n=1 Tax=Natronomonas aquatica TaxID=2841590 RepID=A0A9R1CU32_9EURY|nr:hypothetical protein [Natronomonas aquatica]MCQ4333992.1 hypothetical protein [Natronomonas aquatica]
MAIDRASLREHWPFVVGAAIIVVGNVAYVLGDDWRLGGPPLFFAVVVVLLLEVGRTLYRRQE